MPPNNPNRGGYRGDATKLRAEVYQFIDSDVLKQTHEENLDNLETLYKRPRTKDNIKQIHQVTAELINLEKELNKRGLLEDEEEPEVDEHAEKLDQDLEDLRKWKAQPKSQEEREMREINDRLEVMRRDAKKGEKSKIRQKYKTVEEYLKDIENDREDYLEKKEEDAERVRKEERAERAQKNQEFEKQEWEEIEKETAAKLQERTEIHNRSDQGAVVEGGEGMPFEKKFKTPEEMEDQAIKDNEALKEYRNSPEYKAEQSLEPILQEINKLLQEYSNQVKEYDDVKESGNNSLFRKVALRFSKGNIERSRRSINDLENLKANLLLEEANYIDKKGKLSQQLDFLSQDNVRGLSEMAEGSVTNDRNKAKFERIKKEIAFLEESYRGKKQKTLIDMENLGVEVLSPENQRLRDMGMDYKYLDAIEELSLKDVYSVSLDADEQIFAKEQEESFLRSPNFQQRIKAIESSLKKNLKPGENEVKFIFSNGETQLVYEGKGTTDKSYLDEVKKAVETYKRKVIETRVRIRRLTKMIEDERKKSPEKANFTKINECMKRIEEESNNLQRLGEQMRQNTTKADHRKRLQKLRDKIPNIKLGW